MPGSGLCSPEVVGFEPREGVGMFSASRARSLPVPLFSAFALGAKHDGSAYADDVFCYSAGLADFPYCVESLLNCF